MSRQDTQFKPGRSGNPSGRPKGSKNRLSEDFLQALAENFEKHGKDAIDHVCSNSPGEYLRIIAGLIPRELLLEVSTEETIRWVINAGPTLSTDEWMDLHGLLNVNPEPAKLENISPDQIIDQLKQDGKV